MDRQPLPVRVEVQYEEKEGTTQSLLDAVMDQQPTANTRHRDPLPWEQLYTEPKGWSSLRARLTDQRQSDPRRGSPGKLCYCGDWECPCSVKPSN